MPERQYQANGRAAVASRERPFTPGTPSRKDKIRESSALQDPGLKDYVRISQSPMSLVPGPWTAGNLDEARGHQGVAKAIANVYLSVSSV
jgi:hypothetical protein